MNCGPNIFPTSPAVAGITDFRAHQIIKSDRSYPKKAIKSVDNTKNANQKIRILQSVYFYTTNGNNLIRFKFSKFFQILKCQKNQLNLYI